MSAKKRVFAIIAFFESVMVAIDLWMLYRERRKHAQEFS